MLVAGPPKAMSLLDVRNVKNDYFYSKEGGWCSEKAQKFARNDKAESVWIALRKKPVADSLSKNWSEQSELVVEPMTVPNAAEAVWGLTTYKAVRGVYLLPNLYVRTSSLDSGGDRVLVGLFDSGGLYVSTMESGYEREPTTTVRHSQRDACRCGAERRTSQAGLSTINASG
jgi:hypothetical protein